MVSQGWGVEVGVERLKAIHHLGQVGKELSGYLGCSYEGRITVFPASSLLPRFLCWRSDWPHFCLYLLQTTLPSSGQHGMSQTICQTPSTHFTEEGGDAYRRQCAQLASGGDHWGPCMIGVYERWTQSPWFILLPWCHNTAERIFCNVILISYSKVPPASVPWMVFLPLPMSPFNIFSL